MSREQHLAELERLLAQIRGEAVEDAAPSGASDGPSRSFAGSPATWTGPSGAQYHQPVLRPPETPPVTLIPPALQPIMDRNGQVVGWTTQQALAPTQTESRGVDVVTQRMVGGGVLLCGGGVGAAFLLKAAEAAVIPLALIALIVVSLAYLKMSAKSAGGGGANINVNVKVNQRNG